MWVEAGLGGGGGEGGADHTFQAVAMSRLE